MKCEAALRRLSAYRDRDLSGGEMRAVTAHLESCLSCAADWRSLNQAIEILAEAPRLAPAESIASRVLTRLEVETRGPGLALLFRPAWAARPLILPSLVPAALVLLAVLGGVFGLGRDAPLPPVHQAGRAWEGPAAAAGTESHPYFPTAGVSVPRARDRQPVPAEVLAAMNEGTLFLETVVARDGSVSTVTLLGGDSVQAEPLIDALRQERFEPGRYRGRPVAVSIYRLISRMDVRPPVT
ncbi:MAG TPA: zf-HC2 domain-containing protein [Vicinamibacteria bacterium]|nr:zf-HC2 domain-containing protein [Vicinamibacteria bacterium]